MQYLVDVGLVTKPYNLREILASLEGAKIGNESKVLFVDVGLPIPQLEEGTAARMLRGDLSTYKGAVTENMVASAFAADGREPTLVECKSNNGRTTSMRYVVSHPKEYGVHPAVKFADMNVGVERASLLCRSMRWDFFRAKKSGWSRRPWPFRWGSARCAWELGEVDEADAE